MALPQVNIYRLANQLSRLQGPDENVAALVAGGIAVVGGAQLNTVYKLLSLKGAEDIGIDKAYDIANKVLVWHHLSEFFRLNPTGEIQIMLVAQGTTLEDMCDKTNDYLKKVLREGEGRIRKAGVVLNPATGYTSSLSGGLDEDVLNAIPKAQELADDEYDAFRPINNIVIEGREFNGTAAAATDLRGLAGGPYRDVSVVIAQDKDMAALDALFAKTAAVGTYLGVSTNKTPSESFAQPVTKFNLVSTAQSRFLTANLSSGSGISSYEDADLSSLNDKGFVFGRTFASYDGVYFNQSSVCAPVTDDYNYSEVRDVINRAVRLTRPVLIPYINSTDFPLLDGRIQRHVAAAIESQIRTALLNMQDDITEVTFILVDPKVKDDGSDYASFLLDPTLRVLIGLLLKGKAVQITVNIGQTVG